MSTLLGDPAAAGPAAPPPRGWRRHRIGVVGAVMVVLAVAVVALLSPHRSGRTAALDPDNPGPDGARAVARVLQADGVDVVVVRSADALDATTVDAGTTVVVTSTEQLGASTAVRLLSHTLTGRLVVVDPSYAVLGALQVDDYPSPLASGDAVPAACDDPLYSGLTAAVDDGSTFAGGGCFPDPDTGRAALVQQGSTTLFGLGEALGDDQVLRADDAAVALRLLGATPRLVWYVPDRADLVADDGVSVRSLLPDAVLPGLALVGVATVLLVAWRGRRLGPLATEPLPVVVKAIETTRSRGRLYRRSGDRAHAATALRTAARGRLAAQLRTGAGVDPAALVVEVARQSGRPDAEVAALLGADAPAPTSDDDLIRLADDLARLDREVRHP